MDEAAITRYITETFPGVSTLVADGTTFYFRDPDRKFPFATLVTNDFNDTFSNLKARPSVYRLNVGVVKPTFAALFGSTPPPDDGSGYDFTALDRIMPHPVYGRMYWVCVLNPSEATFRQVEAFLAEAYELAGKRGANRESAGE